MIELGSMAKDKVTGFEGFVVARTDFQDGRVSYGLLPKELKEGVPRPMIWLEAFQLVQIAPPETVAAFA